MEGSFKKILGKPLSEMTPRDLLNLMANEDAMFDLLNNTRSISEEVLRENKDENIRAQFLPILLNVYLLDEEREIGGFYKEHENDRDAVMSFLMKKLQSGNHFSVLPAAHLFVAFRESEILEENLEEIQIAILKFIEDMEKMNINSSYQVLCEFLDLIYQVRQGIYELLQIDPLTEKERLNSIVKTVSDFANPLYEKAMEEIRKEFGDIKPEELGVLDITKTNKKEEDENGF